MPKIHGVEGCAVPGPKECWHPYGLQMLRPDKFTIVANSILRGQNRLLPVARSSGDPLIVYRPLLPR